MTTCKAREQEVNPMFLMCLDCLRNLMSRQHLIMSSPAVLTFTFVMTTRLTQVCTPKTYPCTVIDWVSVQSLLLLNA